MFEGCVSRDSGLIRYRPLASVAGHEEDQRPVVSDQHRADPIFGRLEWAIEAGDDDMENLSVQSREVEADPRDVPDLPKGQRHQRAAFWTFVVAQALIFAGLMWNFHGEWFVADEWVFIAGRTAGNLSGLIHPYHEHWSTLPILYYRLLWNLVGIRSYIPYLASVLAMHIAIGFSLRSIMIRAQALPWIATLCALVFSLYGAGYSDISYGFNVSFDGSVLFGLLFLLAADHAGAIGRRDVLGVIAGLAALMCSGIGVAMIIAVALAIWIRHGLRRALLLILPLAAIYVIWFITVGHGAYSKHSSLIDLVRFAAYGLAITFSTLGSSPIVGSLLVVLLVAGAASSFRSLASSEFRSRFAAPYALVIGAIVFLLITGFGRADFSLPSGETYGSSRYIYIVAAMLMPGIAVAASQLILRWSFAWVFVVAVLLVGVPGNIAELHRNNHLHELDLYRQFVLSIPKLPVAENLPKSVRPDPYFDNSITLGWLFAGVQSGRIPAPSPPPTQAQTTYWNLRLAWQRGHPATTGTCESLSLPQRVQVERGASLTITAAVHLTAHYGANRASTAYILEGAPHPVTYVTEWPFDLTITPTVPGQSVTLCMAHQ